jgi:hypothetical protein
MLTSLKPDIAARQLVFQLNIPVTHFARAFCKCFLQVLFSSAFCNRVLRTMFAGIFCGRG